MTLDADGYVDEIRRLDKDVRKLKVRLEVSEQARERLELHLDKHNLLFKANIHELSSVLADREKQIVERKLAMEALRASEEKYRILLDESGDPIFSFYPDGQYRYVNRAFALTVGKKPEDIIGRKIWDVFPKEEADRRFANVKWVCENAKGRDIEVRVPRPDGDRYFLTTATPVFDDDRRVISVICSSKDITERKLAEEARQEALSRLQKIASQVPGIVFQFRLRPDGSTCVPYASEAIRDIWRLDREDVRDDASMAFAAVHPADLDSFMASIQASAQDLAPWTHEFRLKFGDEPGKWLFGNAVPQREADGSTLWHGFITDITGRKQAEIELRQAKEQAESATKLKDKFISLVSHDLRSPIAMIQGSLKFLQADLSAQLDPPKAKLMESSASTCDRLVKMIDQLLDISRLQTGSIKLAPRFMDARSMAMQIVSALAPQAEAKGVALVNAITERTRIYADYNLIYEVVTNLLANAIKFTRAGDTITLLAPMDNPGALVVKDTGVGIPPHIIPNLFLHEVKTTTTGTSGERGTGLGLPFCKDIMSAHGGSLSVESEVGKGSAFCAALPVRTPVALVADDDPDHREILSWYVKKAGIRVVEAGNGLEALDIIRSSCPDILITDINMPVMDGVELLGRLKEAFGGKPPPAIAVTSSRDKLLLERAFYAGAADVIAKPVDENEFIPRLNRLLMIESA
ncbi:MAG: response regulator [Nitrospinae bacterium]|nr:response regulator [Nitrospinota bacterium]MBF0633583.1 response regulator [Nitrospinota bacterium]